MGAGHSGHVILVLVHGHAEEVYSIDKGYAINQSMIFILHILPFICLPAQSFTIELTIHSFIHPFIPLFGNSSIAEFFYFSVNFSI